MADRERERERKKKKHKQERKKEEEAQARKKKKNREKELKCAMMKANPPCSLSFEICMLIMLQFGLVGLKRFYVCSYKLKFLTLHIIDGLVKEKDLASNPTHCPPYEFQCKRKR